MNWEGQEPEEYYDKQDRKHIKEFECAVFAGLIIAAICVAVGLIIGAHRLGCWLLGGA